jgi:hypothetical protein
VVDALRDDVAVFVENGTQCIHQIGAQMDGTDVAKSDVYSAT